MYAVDRFSRSRLDHALYESLLKKAGVHRLAKLGEKRVELERLKATVEMFRQIGGKLRKWVEESLRPAAMLLRRMIRRIIVRPTGSIKAELVIGTHENIKGSADEFDISDRWWRWGESNPRPRTCQ